MVCRNNCHHSADRLRHNRDGRASVIITKVARSEENWHAREDDEDDEDGMIGWGWLVMQ